VLSPRSGEQSSDVVLYETDELCQRWDNCISIENLAFAERILKPKWNSVSSLKSLVLGPRLDSEILVSRRDGNEQRMLIGVVDTVELVRSITSCLAASLAR
jgi:hypothetical protein